MSTDDEPVPLDACALPGTVSVTRRAMEAAERFQTVVPAGWIVAFWWYDGGRRRANNDAPWVDTGPGLGLGAYKIDEIPAKAIFHDGSFRYAVLIRDEIIKNYPRKMIDLDDDGGVIIR